MENKDCIKCKQEINPLRLKALPNTLTCVNCSTTGARVAVPMTFGEKDHTWNEVVFMEPTDFELFQKKKTVPLDKLEDEEEEEVVEEDEDDMSIWDATLLDGLEDEE
jgi:hypothetical protein